MTEQYKLSLFHPDEFDEEEFRNSKVWAIKHTRMLTGDLSLKDAAAVIQQLIDDPETTVLLPSVVGQTTKQAINAIEQLASVGIYAEPALKGPLALVKQAAFEAMELGDHAFCKDLLEVLIKHGGE